jgi:hypothetical protein
MSVPTTKQIHILRSISDLHFTDKSQLRVSQFACGIAPSQVRDANLEEDYPFDATFHAFTIEACCAGLEGIRLL